MQISPSSFSLDLAIRNAVPLPAPKALVDLVVARRLGLAMLTLKLLVVLLDLGLLLVRHVGGAAVHRCVVDLGTRWGVVRAFEGFAAAGATTRVAFGQTVGDDTFGWARGLLLALLLVLLGGILAARPAALSAGSLGGFRGRRRVRAGQEHPGGSDSAGCSSRNSAKALHCGLSLRPYVDEKVKEWTL